jgi:high-affinity Fe2+/Pb2+ permease
MIQRIQTLYLTLVLSLSVVLAYGVQWSTLDLGFQGSLGMLVFGEGVLSALLAVGSIFWYRNRQNQFVINRLNLISQLFLLGFFVYRSLNVSGEVATSEKGIGMLIPIFSIVFLVLANRAIKKDEDLVKSADRLR